MRASTRPRRALGRPLAAAVAAAVALSALGVLLGPAAPAGAATAAYTATGRVSLTSTGAQVGTGIHEAVFLSADGRFVAFASGSALTPDDTSANDDVYLRDRLGGTVRLVSLTDADVAVPGSAFVCALSRDGRYVAFTASGAGLPVDTDQVYVRDVLSGTTSLVSVSSSEVPSTLTESTSGISIGDTCAISDDGRYVAFESEDGTLAPGGSTYRNVYRRDRQSGTTQLVSAATSGVADQDSDDPAISADGGTVAFASDAANLVAGDTNGDRDVFVRTVGSGTTQRVSVAPGGGQVDGGSQDPSITADGKRVAFTSHADDLVTGDLNGYDDVFVKNRQTGGVLRASLWGDETEIGSGGRDAEISDDGRYVSFRHFTPSALPKDDNGATDVLRRDVVAGSTGYVSVAPTGWAGDGASTGHDTSGDGTAVAFVSEASDLMRNDTNGATDVFVRDHRVDTTPFASRAAFVHRQYVDLYGRAPSGAEKAMWEGRLAHGEVVPEEVVDALARSTTFAGRRAPVIRLYWAFFLRVPDEAGMGYWIGQAQAGVSLAKVATKFAASPELAQTYGPLTNAAFVAQVYDNVLDREPDAAGLAYWTAQLDTGTRTRGDVMVGFSESPEGRRHIAPVTDSVLFWLGMMGTVPPASWSLGAIGDAYAAGEPPEVIARTLLASPAYQAQVA